METRVAAVIVRAVELATEPEVAVTVTDPNPTAVATPSSFRVAMLGAALVQVAAVVRSSVLPSV